MELRARDLGSLLPEAHRPRVVWAWLQRAGLSRMYAAIRAVEGGCGRTAIAHELRLPLRFYVTLGRVASTRGFARLTQAQGAFRWIGGGVAVNDHTLPDFRSVDSGAQSASTTRPTRP